MALNQILNGFGAALFDRDELMFRTIAEKFNLKLDDVRSTAHEACDKQKPKAIKPQKRQAKRTGAGGKKKRAPSAYQFFANEHREQARNILRDDEDERTFNNKDGDEVTIDSADFKENGDPKFGHITQKVAAMWHALAIKEKGPYVKQAEEAKASLANAPSEPESDEDEKPKKASAKKAKKAPAKSDASDSSDASDASSNDASESDTEEVPKRKAPPARKGARGKRGGKRGGKH